MAERIRIVIAEPGLEGHNQGAQVVARALRDAGMEVIYTGRNQTAEQIVQTVVQEDADAVGLPALVGAHAAVFRQVVELLAEAGASDVVVFGGGTGLASDLVAPQNLGDAKIIPPGATTDEIVDWVRLNVASQSAA